MFTVLFCVNAAGTWLPTYTIYKSKNIWYEWTVGGYPGAQYGCSPSGWMEALNFETWFTTKFVSQTQTAGNAPRLFIFDGHSSHISYKIAKCAFDHNIHILCLPPIQAMLCSLWMWLVLGLQNKYGAKCVCNFIGGTLTRH